jgi:predicted polyphosphate/ATP-dependent NAD kinase
VLPLSTGTNNAFPEMWEATVAGTAAALVATGRIGQDDGTYRAKALTVETGRRTEIALVDVCVNTALHVGSRALWEVRSLRELYCTFGEPHAIGLSSVVGQARPVGRRDPGGVVIALDADAEHRVLAPIAPGVLTPIGIAAVDDLRPGEPVASAVTAGTVAVDGEREIEFGARDAVTVTLRHDGPRVVDVRAVLAVAARDGLLAARDPDRVRGGTP